MTNDKKPSTAAEAEAHDVDMITVEWRGRELVIPASIGDWPFEATEAVEEIAERSQAGEQTSFRLIRQQVEALLGPAQWRDVRRGLSLTALSELGAMLMLASGEVAPGE